MTETTGVPSDGYTPGRAARFYIPLMLQAFSQSLTYPLVATIVSRGPQGVDGYAAFAMGQTVMFMIGAFGCGLISTGMVFGRSLRGFREFKKLNYAMATALFAVQILICLPPFDRLVFHLALGLPADLWPVARNTLLWGQVMQWCFFIRNIPFVALFNEHRTAEANFATLMRIALAAIFAVAFPALNWVGPGWGCIAITIPVALEMSMAWVFAARHIAALPDSDPAPKSAHGQFAFTIPLSIGGMLLAIAPFLIGVFIGHAEDHVRMYAIHIVTIGLANPLGFAALRMQSVAIAFPPHNAHDHGLLKFTAVVGILLALPLLLVYSRTLSQWYFSTIQNLDLKDLPRALNVATILALMPFLQAFRGYYEGVAAHLKRPMTVLAGQIVHMATLVATLFVLLVANVKGCYLGAIALIVAIAAATLVIARLIRNVAHT